MLNLFFNHLEDAGEYQLKSLKMLSQTSENILSVQTPPPQSRLKETLH